MTDAADRGGWIGLKDDRYQVRSTILTSQLPVSRWHEQIGDPPLADGMLDRLVHNAHRIDMKGDSMRNLRESRRAVDQNRKKDQANVRSAG